MVSKWVMYGLLCLFMLCEKVDGSHGWGSDDHDDHGGGYGAGMLMFEIIVIIAIVAFWVWLFQVMDGASYLAWQTSNIPPPPCVAPETCASVRIPLRVLKQTIRDEVKKSIHSEMHNSNV